MLADDIRTITDNLRTLEVVGTVIQCFFAFAFGACVGSLINVLVYRLPRGMSVVTPPSRCPACGTRLTWRENIPVLGWLVLGGRCRFCKSKISPEYPIVEAVVGGMFLALFALWYIPGWPDSQSAALAWWTQWRPEWTDSGFRDTWPAFVVVLVLVSSLVAMTLVDAKTATIPLILAWVPAGLALLVHPVHAAVTGHLPFRAEGWAWMIPTPDIFSWQWIGAALGGTLGLVIANVLLATGLISRSFADYEQWEKQARAERAGAEAGATGAAEAGAPATPAPESHSGPVVHDPIAVPAAPESAPPAPALATSADAPTPRAEVAADAPAQAHTADDTPHEPAPAAGSMELWIAYPHARREMLKELVFLAPVVGLAFAGAAVALRLAGPISIDPETGAQVAQVAAPLWLRVLAGALLGYLIGGGVVWAVRILGSLAFGREAMGLGDVHLMAAVGAALGWIDATLAFFGAAFVGVAYAIAGRVVGGAFKKAMPYGPFLAVATLLVLVFKPLVERGLGVMMGRSGPLELP